MPALRSHRHAGFLIRLGAVLILFVALSGKPCFFLRGCSRHHALLAKDFVRRVQCQRRSTTRVHSASTDDAGAGVPPQNFDALFNSGVVEQIQDLRGKWALVTGASSGIGKATVCALAACGCNVAMLARRKHKLEKLRAAIVRRKLPVETKTIVADVNSETVREALAEHGCLDGIDILIANAGLARGKDPVGSASMQDWQEMLATNCLGAFRVVNEVLPGMLKRGGGDVILLGSIAGLEAYEGGSVYAASKHAVHAFMRALRYETYQKNIRCTVVAPGFVGEGTEFSEVRFQGDTQKAAAVYAGMQELRASDIAAQIVWAIRQPPHVCLDMIHVMPTCQGGATRIHRDGAS